jgi:hypothetical protein
MAWGTLALILHMAHDPELARASPVGEKVILNVRRLMLDYILPHGYEFYCGTQTAAGERLRRLASWILTGGKRRILASDLTTNIADCRGLTLNELQERVSPLVAGGWLQPEDVTPMCRAWAVSPQVHLQLAERARAEEERKGKLAALMGSSRGMHDMHE